MESLIQKYNVPGPRYSSYPTVPFWKNRNLSQVEWLESIAENQSHFNTSDASLYIHLPFCESMCTFCGCHKRITKNHAVEEPYIESVLKEWKLYQDKFTLQIREIHLGGGTPTFFKAEALKQMITHLMQDQQHNFEGSFEAHPNNTSEEHLKVLYELGFRRLSLGVQDYDPQVQKAIHRIQTKEQVKFVHRTAKEMGYTSISHDLVFGLPKQQLSGFLDSIAYTIQLRPDRISLYSYAHVPWIKGLGQRGFDEADLPDNEEKRNLYEAAKKHLLDAGYLEIGMDHFALPEDDLAKAFLKRKLHRNFMGYTTQQTDLLIGLGASAISDSWFGFAQNEKSIEGYQQGIEAGELSIFRGHLLNEEDLLLRKCILNLMCHFETKLPEEPLLNLQIRSVLETLKQDDLIEFTENTVSVKTEGLPFIRNVCMAFDRYLQGEKHRKNLFSKII